VGSLSRSFETDQARVRSFNLGSVRKYNFNFFESYVVEMRRLAWRCLHYRTAGGRHSSGMAFFNNLGRRAPRNPRRSPTTPTSPAFGGPEMGFQPPPPPSPNAPKPLYLSKPFVEAALVKGNFKTIVMLPKYVDVTEWVAVNIFDFFNNLNLFYAVVSECCTSQTCPTMSAGPHVDYTWIDSNNRQVKLPAPTYIDYVVTWAQKTLDDENVFPTKAGREFPPNFPKTVKHIYRQLLRVFAHIYHAHYHQLLHLRSEPHFNSLFAHFLAFGREYTLLEQKDLRGAQGAPIPIGELWEKWRDMGILEGDPAAS